jgi:hypothetical protein
MKLRRIAAVFVACFAAGFFGAGLAAVFASPPATPPGQQSPPPGKPTPPAPPASYQITTTATDVPPNASKPYPGGAGALYLRLDNKTGVTVKVVSLNAGTITPTNCAVSLNSTAVNNWLATKPTVPDKATVVLTVPSALVMGQAANSCQGATLTVPVTVGAQKAK